ncbi:unnamed protein product [Porites evermanni]|uniref:PLAT domain-containing protein n=1 Tax=Porites evermanni TaxID=104178 RepID=A0ABN8M8W1_9CNID|nr:unnamed protein product [Porites evermanni]
MVFLVLEVFVVTLVACALSFPRNNQFEHVHDKNDPVGLIQEDPELLVRPKLNDEVSHAISMVTDEDPPDEVYPVEAENKVQDPHQDDLKEVYPLTNAEQEFESTFPSLPDEDPPGEEYPVDTETKVEDPHQEDPKEVYPLVSSKGAQRVKRGANEDDKWPATTEDGQTIVRIPYVESDQLSDNTKRWLKTVIHQLDQDTCIRFKEKTNSDSHWVEFKTGSGLVSISYGVGVVRPSGVKSQNRLTSQFDIIYDQQLWDFGYDISSDMQYNEYAFSQDGTSKTMDAKNGQPLGSNSHMDAMDVEKVNKLYGCPYIDCYQKAQKQIAESVSNLLISATYNYTVVDHEIVLKTGDSLGDGTNADPFMKLIGSNGETPFQLVTSGGMLYADENEQGAKSEGEYQAVHPTRPRRYLPYVNFRNILNIVVDHAIILKTEDSWLAGTNGDPFLKLIGSTGETPFQLVTSGGMLYVDENERGADETHELPFPNVGTISSIKVALVNKGETPSGTRKRGFIADWTNGKWIPKHEKRFLFSTDGWTLESVTLDGTEFGGATLYVGEEATVYPA